MRLFIEPVEPLLFRTGLPFDAGQDTFAESLFPPTPETLQGAVRATIAAHWHPHKNIAEAFEDLQLTDLIGDRESYGRFRMTEIALGRYHTTQRETIERLFPSPAHIMKTETQLYRLIPKELDKTVKTNFPEGMSHYLAPEHVPGDDLKPLDGWLTEADLDRTLGRDDITNIQVIKRSEIYQEEPRLGIGIQRDTKSTDEGFLYQMVMIRMNHESNTDYLYGFVVDIQLAPSTPHGTPPKDEQIQHELHLPDEGWMTIGGEQRTAHFRVVPTPQRRAPTTRREHSLLYLATPAVFDGGWQPSSKFAPLDKPLAAAIQRYESIGGWKLNSGDAKGENKTMRRCVPAGSVYFYDRPVAAPSALTDHGMEIGYGIHYEGEW